MLEYPIGMRSEVCPRVTFSSAGRAGLKRPLVCSKTVLVMA